MGNATYPVFVNKKSNERLAFYPVKKNANTSSKFFFASHLGIEDKFFYLEDKIPRFKQTQKMHDSFRNKSNLVNLYQGKHAFQKINVEFKSCIVRDPLERFISAYRNRILFHKDEDFNNHSVSEVIEKLEGGVIENRHFLPQNYFLGDNLSYFNIVGSLNKINLFEEKVNNFFGQKRKFPKLQIGGKEHQLNLTLEQKNKIKKIYEKDYNLVEKYL
tara:strand:- start:284 stop:931 length:648 start_codon:yes stop_codon:yes gene_type:complete